MKNRKIIIYVILIIVAIAIIIWGSKTNWWGLSRNSFTPSTNNGSNRTFAISKGINTSNLYYTKIPNSGISNTANISGNQIPRI